MSGNRSGRRAAGSTQDSGKREVVIDDGERAPKKLDGLVRFSGVPMFPGASYPWIAEGILPGYIRVHKIMAGQAVPAPWYKGVPAAMTEDAIKDLWGNGIYLIQLISRATMEHSPEVIFERTVEIDDGEDGIPFPGEERSAKTLADCSAAEEEEEEETPRGERAEPMASPRFSRREEEPEEPESDEQQFQSRPLGGSPSLFSANRPRFYAPPPGAGGGLYQTPPAPYGQSAPYAPSPYAQRAPLYQPAPQETAIQTVPPATPAVAQTGGTAALVAAAAPIVTGLFTMLAEGRKADQERLRYERERDERREEARKEAEERRAEERAARDRADAENQRNFLMAMFNKQGDSAKEIAEKEAARERERRELELERERARQAREKEDRDALREEIKLARQSAGAGGPQNFDQTLSMFDKIAERTVQNQPEPAPKEKEEWWKPFLPLIPQILPLLLSGGSIPPNIVAMLQQASGDPNIMAKIPELLSGMGVAMPQQPPMQAPMQAPMPQPPYMPPVQQPVPNPPTGGYDPGLYQAPEAYYPQQPQPAPEAYYPPQPPPVRVAPPPMSEHQQPLPGGGGGYPQPPSGQDGQ